MTVELVGRMIGQRCLGSRKPRNRKPKRRTRDVVHAHLVTERYGLGIAGVLATDADFQLGVRLTPTLDPHSDECANALSVDRLERIFGHDT